jgi:hypothetical protein
MNMRVIAVNISLNFIEVFDSIEAAVKRCPGLEIAEGDWLFFAGDGSALSAVFSQEPYVDSERNVYGNGIYSLASGNGVHLQDWLFDFCRRTGDFHFGTLKEFERLFT